MKKRVLCLLLALVCILGGRLPAASEEAAEFYLFVDGQWVSDAHVVLTGGTTYVSAYVVSKALCPDTAVSWNGGSSEMTLTGTGYALSVQYGRDYVVCNGRYLYTPGQVILHPENGDLLLPVRVLARALGAPLGWDAYGVYLASGGTPLTAGEDFYDPGDLEMLARTIRHEAGYQPLAGQIAVGNVILNRVRSSAFPGTVYEVIHQKGQFPNTQSLEPWEQHYIAAKLAMDGGTAVPAHCFWFNAAGKSFWASTHKSLLCVIGNQAFYG